MREVPSVFSCARAPIRTTALTTLYLKFGLHPCFTADVFSLNNPADDLTETVDGLISRLHLHWKVAHTTLLQTVSQDTAHVNPHRSNDEISFGDQVLVNITRHDAKSLFPRGPLVPYFSGPYTVLAQVHINGICSNLRFFVVEQQRTFDLCSPLQYVLGDA